MAKVAKEYFIKTGNAEVFKSSDLSLALAEYSKNKYLLGFKTVVNKMKDEQADARITSYLSEIGIDSAEPSKITRVLIERVHTNKAKKLRSQLAYRLIPVN